MNIAEFAVNKRVAVVMILVGLVLLGIIALQRIPQQLYPSVTFPQLTIVTPYANAAPEEIETLITKPIEEAVGSVAGLKAIDSISREGLSVVTVSFTWGTDIDFAALALREKVDLVKDRLPKEAEDPVVIKFDPFAKPVMILSMTGPYDPVDLKLIADKTLKGNLEKVEGVASVQVSGGLDREILVEVDQGRMQASNLSLLTVIDALDQANLSYPAGSIKKGLYEYLIRTMGEFKSVSDIEYAVAGTDRIDPNRLQKKQRFIEREDVGESRETVSNLRGEDRKERANRRLILFNEIANVKDTYKEKTSVSRYNGRDNISLTIHKQAGANSIQVVKNIEAALALLEEELNSRGVKLEVIYDSSEYVKEAIKRVRDDGLMGAFLAFLSLLFFLRSFGSAVTVILTLPFAIMGVFFMFYFKHISINVMSLGGLALGIGNLVDHTIVIIENIYRLKSTGLSPKDAAIEGTTELVAPVFSSLLSNVAVFFPLILFVPGVAGQLFKDLSWTVVFTLILGVLVSLMMIPLASLLIKPKKTALDLTKEGRLDREFIQKPRREQNRIMLAVVGGSFALCFLGMLLMGRFDREVMPKTDQGQFILRVDMPVGTRLEVTTQYVTEIESILLKIPEVQNIAESVGSSKGESTEANVEALRSNQGQILVNLKPKRKKTSSEVVQDLKKQIDKIDLNGGRVQYLVQESEFTFGGAGGEPIVVEVRGNNFNTLRKWASEVKDVLKSIQGVFDIKDDEGEPSPETRVEIDKKKAALYGISARDISLTVKAAIEGAVATKYKEEGREFDIRVRLREQDRNDIYRLGELLIHSNVLDTNIPLKEVARLDKSTGPSEIKRINQERTITVLANISPGYSKKDILGGIQKGIEGLGEPPDGYSVKLVGEAEETHEALKKVTFAVSLSIILIYMVMASQFESFIQPFIIMFTVPLSIVGMSLAMWISHTTLNVISMLGMVMLAGVVVNNGIILIEYTNQMRGSGLPLVQAAIKAARTRLRPVMISALTNILGLVPMALGIGGKNNMQPLAVVMLGGLLSSTFFTIFVVPAAYILITRIQCKLFNREEDMNPEEVITGAKAP